MDIQTSNILSQLGHVMEKMLTFESDDFDRFKKASARPWRDEEMRDKREAYYYNSVRRMCLLCC